MNEAKKDRKTKEKGEQFQYCAVLRDNLDENFLLQSPILRKYVEEGTELTPAEAEALLFEEDYKIQNCFYCPYCGDRLKLVALNSKHVNMHFRHTTTNPKGEKDHPPIMSRWHKKSQEQFELIKNAKVEDYIKVSDEDRSQFPFLKNRDRFFADIQVLSNNGKRIIIEYQKSYISIEAFTRRTEFYSKHADIFIWVFDGYIRDIIEAPMLAALSQLSNVALFVDNYGNPEKDIFNPRCKLYWVPKNLDTRICHDIQAAIINNGIPISKEAFVSHIIEGTINDITKVEELTVEPICLETSCQTIKETQTLAGTDSIKPQIEKPYKEVSAIVQDANTVTQALLPRCFTIYELIKSSLDMGVKVLIMERTAVSGETDEYKIYPQDYKYYIEKYANCYKYTFDVYGSVRRSKYKRSDGGGFIRTIVYFPGNPIWTPKWAVTLDNKQVNVKNFY